MNDKDIVQEWVSFAEMDLNTAKHLDKTMFPQPLAIICYHCQQAVEKYLKGALVLFGVEIRKTHDLGLLAEEVCIFLSNIINKHLTTNK